VHHGGRSLHFQLALPSGIERGCLSAHGGAVGMDEMSYEILLGGSEPSSPREGVSFSSAPLRLPMLSGHDERDRMWKE
jgi:hypothetical protein